MAIRTWILLGTDQLSPASIDHCGATCWALASVDGNSCAGRHVGHASAYRPKAGDTVASYAVPLACKQCAIGKHRHQRTAPSLLDRVVARDGIVARAPTLLAGKQWHAAIDLTEPPGRVMSANVKEVTRKGKRLYEIRMPSDHFAIVVRKCRHLVCRSVRVQSGPKD